MGILKGLRVIVVTHVAGMREPNVQEFTEKNRQIVASQGGIIVTAAHAFSGLSAAMRQRFSTSVMGDVIVSFQSKTKDRPAWKIWINSEYGLVVRTEIYDIKGNLALLSAFSELTLQPKLPEKTFTMTVPKGTTVTRSVEQSFQSVKEAQEHVSFSISEPTYMPSGFILSTVIVSKTKQGEKIQLAYIDGMSSLSVFEDKRTSSSTATSPKTSKEVAINSTVKGTFRDHGLLKILDWNLAQDVHVTLIGEVADSELLKIASSITSINTQKE